MMAKTQEQNKEKNINNAVEEWAGLYFYATGRRKTAIAQVRIYPVDAREKGVVINRKKLEEYFPVVRLRTMIKTPLSLVGQEEKFDVSAKVSGGGINSQAEAVQLGISKALILFDETFRKVLRSSGLLTRDSRIVERKKPGLKKARRAPQWSKR